MKLSSRERIMLYVLAVLAILAIGYFLFIKPQLDKVDTMKIDEDALNVQIQSLDSELALSDQLDTDIEDIKVKIDEMTKPFYPEILKDKIMLILEDLIVKSGIESTAINYGSILVNVVKLDLAAASEEEIYSIKTYADNYKSIMNIEDQTGTEAQPAEEATSDVPAEERKLESFTVKLQIESTYEQLINFIKEVEALDKTIVVTSVITVTGSTATTEEEEAVVTEEEEEEDKIVATVEIVFYAITKITDQDEDYYIWPES